MFQDQDDTATVLVFTTIFSTCEMLKGMREIS